MGNEEIERWRDGVKGQLHKSTYQQINRTLCGLCDNFAYFVVEGERRRDNYKNQRINKSTELKISSLLLPLNKTVLFL